MTTFPLFKLHSSNSHFSNLLPQTGSPLVSCSFFGGGRWVDGKCSSNHRVGRPSYQRELGANISSTPPLEGNIGTPDQG